ncbi:MAG TPA: plastocyanin/azurin family copper-binding protein [Gemmatimonadaceae bacterium]
MNIRRRALFAVTCFVASACGGGGYGSTPPSTTSPNTPPVADQVDATASLAFDPPTLTTQLGHAVTFAFGSVGHNVFFDPATGTPVNITGVNANTSVTRTFDTAGTFTYTCHIHPYMQGKVVVE